MCRCTTEFVTEPFLGVDQARLCLCDGQIEDLLFIRRVYLLEHRELNRQKAALIADLEKQDANPITEATLLTSIGSRLRNNAAEAYELLYKYSWCIYYGVSHVSAKHEVPCSIPVSDFCLCFAAFCLHSTTKLTVPSCCADPDGAAACTDAESLQSNNTFSRRLGASPCTAKGPSLKATATGIFREMQASVWSL